MKEMIAAWRQGDEVMLSLQIDDAFGGSGNMLYQQVFSHRNTRMHLRLAELLTQKQRVFVAVGAGHVIGVNGLASLFADSGYAVAQLRP
jgi:hypothetical protein